MFRPGKGGAAVAGLQYLAHFSQCTVNFENVDTNFCKPRSGKEIDCVHNQDLNLDYALECVDTSQLGAFSLSLSCASPVFFDNMLNIAFKSRTRPEQRQRKIAPKHSCPHTLEESSHAELELLFFVAMLFPQGESIV